MELIPLYLYAVVGYLTGKYFEVDKLTINKVLVFLLLPVILFNTGYTLDFTTTDLAFPFVILILVSILTFVSLWVFGLFWDDDRKNISAFNFASSNFAYLGLAIAYTIFSEKTANLYTLIIPAMMVHQFTFGIYTVARGKYLLKQGIVEILKLPLLYTLILGVIFNCLNVDLGDIYLNVLSSAQAAFIILAMMVVGLSISSIDFKKFDREFVGINIIGKFIAWPMIAILLVILDEQVLHLFKLNHYHAFLLLSLMPISLNSVVFADQFKTQSEKTKTTVDLSTIAAAIYVITMIMLLGIGEVL